MQFILAFLTVLASALAAPATVPEELNTAVPANIPAGFSIAVRDESRVICNREYCRALAYDCWKTCASLTNGDWYVFLCDVEKRKKLLFFADRDVASNSTRRQAALTARMLLKGVR